MPLTNVFKRAVDASKTLILEKEDVINQVLNTIADQIIRQTSYILSENQKDLDRMDKNDPKYDRLLLSTERIKDIAAEMKNVALLPSPLRRCLMENIRPNGLKISKISVPFGVIGIIYEARPNVSLDVFSLCIKSGNVCILKGGSDADCSNKALAGIIREVLTLQGINPDICILLPAEREATTALLNATAYIDLIIPRGSQGLIQYVRNHSKIPIIETGAGICHTYFDEFGDKEKGSAIILNAKTRRVSVCNALDCLIIHKKRLLELSDLCKSLSVKRVIIEADEEAYQTLKGQYPPSLLKQVTAESFGTEFLDYRMSVKTVENISEAIAHISKHSSKHSECIVSENKECIALFETSVDAACIYSNASTAFTDGAQFGLGAEIGISTQKLHARGPMALEELTSYKWIIQGEGQVRS